MVLSIDLGQLTENAKTQLANSVTEATIHSMYAAGSERDAAMAGVSTRLVVVTSRRLTAAPGSQAKAITTIKVANAAAASAAQAQVASVAATIQSAALAKARAVPGMASAVPGGSLDNLSVSAPVAAVKQVTVTPTTTAAPVPPSNHVADTRCRLEMLFALLMASAFLQ
jgi:hypothetical protein